MSAMPGLMIVIVLLLTAAVEGKPNKINEHHTDTLKSHEIIIPCRYTTADDPGTFLETKECPDEICNSGPFGEPLQVNVNGTDMVYYFCNVNVEDFVTVSDACRVELNGTDVLGSHTRHCKRHCDTGPVSYTLVRNFPRYSLQAGDQVDLWLCKELPPYNIKNYFRILNHNACENTFEGPDGLVIEQRNCPESYDCDVGPVDITYLNKTTSYKFCSDDSPNYMLDIWSKPEVLQDRQIEKEIIMKRDNSTSVEGSGDEEKELIKPEYKKESRNELEILLEKLKNNIFDDLFT